MGIEEVISREAFAKALTTGVDVFHEDENSMFLFGERMITWFNNAENDYWACWNPDKPDDILIDFKHYSLISTALRPGKVKIMQSYPTIAESLPFEFGDAALGVILFCMLENEELTQIDTDAPPAVLKTSIEPDSDFEWI